MRRRERDVQGRVVRDVRADGVTDTHYPYDLAVPLEAGIVREARREAGRIA